MKMRRKMNISNLILLTIIRSFNKFIEKSGRLELTGLGKDSTTHLSLWNRVEYKKITCPTFIKRMRC